MSNIPNLNEMLKLYTKKDLWERIQHHIQTIDQLKQQLEELMLLLSKYEIEEHKPVYCTLAGTECEYLGKVEELKQQLAEKDKEIAHLKEKDNYHLRYELAGADETITNLKQQLEEKDKEIEKLKQQYTILDNENGKLTTELIMGKYKKAQKEVSFGMQLAIQELEKIKNKCDGMYDLWLNSKYKENMYDNEDIAGAFEDISVFANDLIKKLKGE